MFWNGHLQIILYTSCKCYRIWVIFVKIGNIFFVYYLPYALSFIRGVFFFKRWRKKIVSNHMCFIPRVVPLKPIPVRWQYAPRRFRLPSAPDRNERGKTRTCFKPIFLPDVSNAWYSFLICYVLRTQRYFFLKKNLNSPCHIMSSNMSLRLTDKNSYVIFFSAFITTSIFKNH